MSAKDDEKLIYDTRGQLHRADERYKKGDSGAKQTMIHDRELIYDAKRQGHLLHKHWHKNK
jgi:hypothetical protein|tara:strand:- start:1217 stop:1399 length:183 start_codon:yes stop_codon:yes gene_type:complete